MFFVKLSVRCVVKSKHVETPSKHFQGNYERKVIIMYTST